VKYHALLFLHCTIHTKLSDVSDLMGYYEVKAGRLDLGHCCAQCKRKCSGFYLSFFLK
jgi:hypothetical protein